MFEGVDVTGYDKFRKEFVSTWRDNMSLTWMNTKGSLSNDKKTMTMSGTHDDTMNGVRDKEVRCLSATDVVSKLL